MFLKPVSGFETGNGPNTSDKTFVASSRSRFQTRVDPRVKSLLLHNARGFAHRFLSLLTCSSVFTPAAGMGSLHWLKTTHSQLDAVLVSASSPCSLLHVTWYKLLEPQVWLLPLVDEHNGIYLSHKADGGIEVVYLEWHSLG